ncbi:MAG: hypothetical protein R3D02_09850 [Hyphomicrobiales bacterium]
MNDIGVCLGLVVGHSVLWARRAAAAVAAPARAKDSTGYSGANGNFLACGITGRPAIYREKMS